MLVGLTGFAGSGKDTAAQALLNVGYQRRAFADPMRKGLLGVNPLVGPAPGEDYGNITLQQLVVGDEWNIGIGWDRAKREYGEVRRLMQAYGTEGGRDIHGQQCWIDAAARTLYGGIDYVFTDVRFPNERDFIHERGGIVIRICRPGTAAANTHASEQVLDDCDAGIINSGSIEELHHEVLLTVVRAMQPKHAASKVDHMLHEVTQRPVEFGGVHLAPLPADPPTANEYGSNL